MVEKNVQLGLKADEEKATEELIQRLTNYDGLTKIEHSVAQQCIMARKLDVERAFNLYLNYQVVNLEILLFQSTNIDDNSFYIAESSQIRAIRKNRSFKR